MHARVTLFDIDPLRSSVPEALERFKELILPDLREQHGYRGVYALTTPEGRGLLMTLWASEEDATAGLRSGFYSEQVEKFVALYREPPGREQYEVSFVELPAAVR